MLRSIDLSLAKRLKDREFRREWFRAELETSVPRLFRTLRERRDLTQSDLAQLADMKQSSISRFEASSDAKWKFETLMKMAEALDGHVWIGLEPAEDAIDRIERTEMAESRLSSVIDRHVDDSQNKQKASASDAKSAGLPKPRTFFEGNLPWR